MYLKCLELVGFKSFAERTKLEFERAMTAIVGPNGCGKSNVSDAIRWVLGEQSARALRGTHMEDCIFNGTDTHKPLAMAEVSLTLSDCEKSLGTEYNEVTVTRRVFRSGEGQYFINKTPCRLKDVQRLFMDTGVGTNSYSVMEQGRIDQILSSRPEDRREVFEEASGITKFKADKKEAIRKLEHTEANLLRLSDIIREVKRQIISLQRQVGKAKRYKILQDQLRRLDIYLARERLETLGREIATLETRLASVVEQDEATRAEVDAAEKKAAAFRLEFSQAEEEISQSMDRAAEVRGELERTREMVKNNRDRIRELEDLSQRETRDSENARAHIAEYQASLVELAGQLEQAIAARDAAEQQHQAAAARLAAHEKETEEVRQLLHRLRTESVDLESQLAKLNNEMYALEAKERIDVIRRERLTAEKADIQRTTETQAARLREMDETVLEKRDKVSIQDAAIKETLVRRTEKSGQAAEVRDELNRLRTLAAERRAQVELLKQGQAAAEGFPGGARLLLDASNPLGVQRKSVLGALAGHLHAEPKAKAALESALRAWLDAVVVADDAAALKILDSLQARGEGAARLLSLGRDRDDEAGEAPEGPGTPLLQWVKCSERILPLARRLLGGVRLVRTLSDIPAPIPPRLAFVTEEGALARGDGAFEFWASGEAANNPLARQQNMVEWQKELDAATRDIGAKEEVFNSLTMDAQTFERSIEESRARIEELQRSLAMAEGERQVISRQAKQSRERLETVGWELESLQGQGSSGGSRRSQIAAEISDLQTRQASVRAALTENNNALRDLEAKHSDLSATATEHRIHHVERRQQVDTLINRKEPLEARIRELQAVIRERAEGVNSYTRRIRELLQDTAGAEQRIEPLQARAEMCQVALEAARRRREEKTAALKTCDANLARQRAAMDEIRSRRSALDVELAEQRMRRQNTIERVTMDYRIATDQIQKEPEPEWENGQKLDREAMETLVAEFHAKIEAMGPVNLVAIEEHQELEQRFAFLSQQQDDLVNAKQQLMDLIRKINKTTTDMFSSTFALVNENFQSLFKKLFGGGSAKLVLVDEENVLESGIEIIARPPGKKLQTVSLLSGGERTMTAVALLFALYMVKPSAFCVLDELDAALDESNIGRFLDMLREFLASSQFIVITHNRQTIGAAEILYGVTMEKQGISKIVSMKFSHHEKPEAPANPQETSPAQEAAAPAPS